MRFRSFFVAASAFALGASLSSALADGTGGSTAANQASQLAQETNIATRAIFFVDMSGSTGLAASATFTGSIRSLGALYTKANALALSTAAGTLQLQACPDSACAAAFTVATVAVSAGTVAILSGVTVFQPYYRVVFVNGGTASSNVYVNTSFTAN